MGARLPAPPVPHVGHGDGGDHPRCESCDAPADIRLDDGSTWCFACDTAARRLGYDNAPAKWIH